MTAPRDLAWPKQTERLSLRIAEEADVEELFRIRRQPSVAEWMTSRTDDFDTFAEVMREPFRIASTVVVELNGRIIGDLMTRRSRGTAMRPSALRSSSGSRSRRSGCTG